MTTKKRFLIGLVLLALLVSGVIWSMNLMTFYDDWRIGAAVGLLAAGWSIYAKYTEVKK